MAGLVRDQIEARYNIAKQNLVIAILGSYRPKSEKRRLLDLKQHLVNLGYMRAALVEDYPDDLVPAGIANDAERVYLKSVHLYQVSHCNFVVATHKGKGRGWLAELSYCCQSCPDGIVKTTVFDQLKDSQSALGAVNRGMVSLHGIAYESFRSSIGLRSAGERTALRYLVRLLDRLT